MTEVVDLDSVAIRAFRKRAIRTVILIDESFPKLSDITAGTVSDKFSEANLAGQLYNAFHSQRLLCDVENDVGALTDSDNPLSDRVRQSDLVVLDYHLRKEGNATDCLRFISRLCESDHFNMVVVYTKDDNLRKVWMQIATTLRGFRPSDRLTDTREQNPEFDERLLDACELEHEYPPAFFEDYLFNRKFDKSYVGEIVQFLSKNHRVLLNLRDGVFPCLAYEGLCREYGLESDHSGVDRQLTGAFEAGKTPWVMCKNVLVAIARKPPVGIQPSTPSGEFTNPGDLVSVLDDAISQWNPGIVRCLISEIQNTISNGRHAASHSLSQDEMTQIAWVWQALGSNSPGAPAEITSRNAIRMLIKRSIGDIEHTLLKDDGLRSFAEACLRIPEVEDVAGKIDHAKMLCGQNSLSENLNEQQVHHALNCFLCSRPFEEDYITTGTIIREIDSGRWWLCIPPACESVPWQAAGLNNPKKRFMSVALMPLRHTTITETDDVMRKTTQGKILFVKWDGKILPLQTRDEKADQIAVEIGFLAIENQLSRREVGKITYLCADLSFPNYRVEQLAIEKRTVAAVAQLHDIYSTRYLHEAGFHVSRIGVDYVNSVDPQ